MCNSRIANDSVERVNGPAILIIGLAIGIKQVAKLVGRLASAVYVSGGCRVDRLTISVYLTPQAIEVVSLGILTKARSGLSESWIARGCSRR